MKNIILLLCIIILGVFSSNIAFSNEITTSQGCNQANEIKAKDYSYLFKNLDGISETQLKQHYTLYTRYVNKLNEINKELKNVDKSLANAAHSDYRSLKVDRAFSNNGVVLHELYFENLTPKKTQPSECFINMINRDFGSFDNYISDLKASMKSTRNGWVITAYNLLDNKIENHIIEFHDLYVPINIKPLLVADVWEHSYMIDYGIDKDSYIKVFLKNIDWQIVSKRFKQALKN